MFQDRIWNPVQRDWDYERRGKKKEKEWFGADLHEFDWSLGES